MDKNIHLRFKANDRSYYAILKKEIHALARRANFSDTRMGEIDIVVAEMASNLSKHAKGGEILASITTGVHGECMEVICADDGPGIPDLNRMLTDGISTKKTLGQGLGAMKRLAHDFHVYTRKETGTMILCRIYKTPPPDYTKPEVAEIKAILIPKPGLDICGDGFYYDISPKFIRLFLGDGLGHGIEANKAVVAAGQAFESCTESSPKEIIRYINTEVKRTRGLVGTVAVFDREQKVWRICGVGNINTKIIGNTSNKTYMPYNGIIGLNVPNSLNVQEIPHENGQHIVLCSDGIKSRWDLVKHPGILRYDLTIAANTIIKEFSRNTDDMSVAICRIN
ncbi:ATP-binding protein [Chitinophaga arvensicola]|uniref:Anti-sigma regulatory factor (Ser/Thr protein kinase) n=1 Tax=Chitinophaga arvensicola TaxID=29529 RepID=A0A1I0R838_9BACT|nr:ATP-binding protein [Chitinophaga arvensicola]SEW36940.1 Anti-sigma regulatory factor (Ser/Thr protein kinase) [Chitinophaga arvensicola]